jgi:hypothetical protein
MREIGIRVALGAGARDVRALLAREVAVLLAIGRCAGRRRSGVGSLTGALLYEVKPCDVGAHVSAVLLLGAIAWLAVYILARPAAWVDRVLALRHD